MISTGKLEEERLSEGDLHAVSLCLSLLGPIKSKRKRRNSRLNSPHMSIVG